MLARLLDVKFDYYVSLRSSQRRSRATRREREKRYFFPQGSNWECSWNLEIQVKILRIKVGVKNTNFCLSTLQLWDDHRVFASPWILWVNIHLRSSAVNFMLCHWVKPPSDQRVLFTDDRIHKISSRFTNFALLCLWFGSRSTTTYQWWDTRVTWLDLSRKFEYLRLAWLGHFMTWDLRQMTWKDLTVLKLNISFFFLDYF